MTKEDYLKHWGVKGMKWDDEKKKKNKEMLSNLLKKANKTIKTQVKPAVKTATKAVDKTIKTQVKPAVKTATKAVVNKINPKAPIKPKLNPEKRESTQVTLDKIYDKAGYLSGYRAPDRSKKLELNPEKRPSTKPFPNPAKKEYDKLLKKPISKVEKKLDKIYDKAGELSKNRAPDRSKKLELNPEKRYSTNVNTTVKRGSEYDRLLKKGSLNPAKRNSPNTPSMSRKNQAKIEALKNDPKIKKLDKLNKPRTDYIKKESKNIDLTGLSNDFFEERAKERQKKEDFINKLPSPIKKVVKGYEKKKSKDMSKRVNKALTEYSKIQDHQAAVKDVETRLPNAKGKIKDSIVKKTKTLNKLNIESRSKAAKKAEKEKAKRIYELAKSNKHYKRR